MTAKTIDIQYLPQWPRLMTRELAAAYCSISPNSFDNHIASHLPPIRMGRSLRYDRLQIDKYLEKLINGSIETESGSPTDPDFALKAL